jgi:hypothetical protein
LVGFGILYDPNIILMRALRKNWIWRLKKP